MLVNPMGSEITDTMKVHNQTEFSQCAFCVYCNIFITVNYVDAYTLKKKVLQGFFAVVMVLYSTTKPSLVVNVLYMAPLSSTI